MRQTSEHNASPWAALIAGVLAVLVVAMLALAWSQAGGAAEGLNLSLRSAAPSLPAFPHLPQGPRLPEAPIPMPR